MRERRRQPQTPGYWTSDEWRQIGDEFVPLRKESRTKLLFALVVGPIAWLLAAIAVVYLVHRTRAIVFGAEVTLAAFVISMILLPILHWGRNREELAYRRRQGS